MATLTIAAAARLCGCPRSTLQRAIRAGRLHLDANHHLEREGLTRAGYLTAAAAQQPQAPAAQQARQDLEDLLRSMQRTMERLTAAIEVLSQELHAMQQERVWSVTPGAAVAPQSRRMERQGDAALVRMQGLRQQGLSYRQIATQLTAGGLPTKTGGAWTKSTVGYLLTREKR